MFITVRSIGVNMAIPIEISIVSVDIELYKTKVFAVNKIIKNKFK